MSEKSCKAVSFSNMSSDIVLQIEHLGLIQQSVLYKKSKRERKSRKGMSSLPPMEDILTNIEDLAGFRCGNC